MRSFVIAFAVLICSACASVPKFLPDSTQAAREAKGDLDAIADRLDDRLTVARGAFAIADQSLLWACGLGVGKAVCQRARVVLETVDGHLKGADDAIDFYRANGTHYIQAIEKLEDAERRVREVRALVESLKRSIS
jgi:hypothetical protein